MEEVLRLREQTVLNWGVEPTCCRIIFSYLIPMLWQQAIITISPSPTEEIVFLITILHCNRPLLLTGEQVQET